jgi:hypothetical protein
MYPGKEENDSLAQKQEESGNIECKEDISAIASSVLLNSEVIASTNGLNSINTDEISPKKIAKISRKTKKDSENRKYKCKKCNKTYLSYPTLYAHMKTKHCCSFEDSPLMHPRSRGRPKKVYYTFFLNRVIPLIRKLLIHPHLITLILPSLLVKQ